MKQLSSKRPIPPSEQGYVLLFAIFLTALLVIALAIAAPQAAKSIQRDKDLETFHRGMQYRRAIQLYYRKFHAYPPNLDALVQTNNIRFLRQKYTDPITGKDDWKPILFGQNKVPTAMGFFGQPLAGTTLAGIGPGGGNGMNGSGGPGSVLPGGIGFASTDTSSNGSNGNFGNSNNSTDSSGTNSGTGTGGDAGSSNGSDQSVQSGQTGLSGQTFGGGGIIGFKPASEKKSILVYKKKNHYNEWEFTYDPISDMQMMSGGNMGNALGSGNNSQPGTNNNSPFSSTTFGSGNNNLNSFGSGNSNNQSGSSGSN